MELAAKTAASIEKAFGCLGDCTSAEANEIISNDRFINELHDKTKHAGFYVIASQQPVAHDLREIVAAMYIADELERVADYAANIAEIWLQVTRPQIEALCEGDIDKLCDQVYAMFRLAISSYQESGTDDAEKLRDLDTVVDAKADSLTEKLFDCMKNDPEKVEDGSRVLWIIHTLERIADRATNIGEQVIFAVTAKEEKLN
jgi:phosphate transport system protein